jgi:hypothetical protein
MSFQHQFIFYVFLAGLAFAGDAKADGNRPDGKGACEAGVINNCSCALPIMRSQLAPAEIDLLMQAWAGIESQPAERKFQFYLERSAALMWASYRYAQIKYEIAWKCGDLAFRDENE